MEELFLNDDDDMIIADYMKMRSSECFKFFDAMRCLSCLFITVQAAVGK
jgi:hypothetical protein